MRRNPVSSCLIEIFMVPFRLLFGVSKSVVRQRPRKSTRHAPREDRKTLVAEQQWTNFVEQYSRLGPDQQIRIWANLSQHQRSYLYTRFRLKSPLRFWSNSCSWLETRSDATDAHADSRNTYVLRGAPVSDPRAEDVPWRPSVR